MMPRWYSARLVRHYPGSALASELSRRLARPAIDTGFETSAVYAWSRQVGFAQVAPIKKASRGSTARAR
jgi:phage terminase large subunit GpA-like protein